MQKLSVIAASMLAACLIGLGGPSVAQHSANAPAHMQHSADTEIATLTALRAGGTVIFMRHERTDVTRLDDQRFSMADCATRRNLSVAGAANSLQTGDYIRSLRIPLGDVLSRPMCGLRQTAGFYLCQDDR